MLNVSRNMFLFHFYLILQLVSTFIVDCRIDSNHIIIIVKVYTQIKFNQEDKIYVSKDVMIILPADGATFSKKNLKVTNIQELN